MTLPLAHPTHVWPFAPSGISKCRRCDLERADRMVALKCIGPELFEGDPAALVPCDVEPKTNG